MSFTFPHPFKPTHQPSIGSPEMAREFELPSFDHRDELSVLPRDYAAGQLAKHALLLSGPEILKKEFGAEDPSYIQRRTTQLAERVAEAGWDTLHDLETPKGDAEAAENQMEGLWHKKALHGDDAMLTLLSLKELARNRSEGFYADRAADALQSVTPDSTRITLE